MEEWVALFIMAVLTIYLGLRMIILATRVRLYVEEQADKGRRCLGPSCAPAG